MATPNFSYVFTEITGEPLKDGEKPFTLRTASVNALQHVTQNDRDISGDEKVRRYGLALRIHAEEKPDLKSEDIALIKDLINKSYPSPVIVAQAWKVLEEGGKS